MIVMKGEIPISPDSREKAIELFSEVSATSLAEEEGVLDYKIGTDIDDPNRLVVVERYADEAAFNSHMEAEHTQPLLEELPNLLAGEPEILRFDVESASELEM